MEKNYIPILVTGCHTFELGNIKSKKVVLTVGWWLI